MPKTPNRSRRDPVSGETLFSAASKSTIQPLAARMRPRSLAEFVGQEHILGEGKALRVAIERGSVSSILLWGPPGSGKTTLGWVMAETTDRVFVPFSAVSEGVPRIREIADQARERLATGGRGTILFIDEIHRLNKAQQDSLLPHVEQGTFTLVGATTEAPSFEINGALLSRCRVFVLNPLSTDDVLTLVRRALADAERGLGGRGLEVDEDALSLVAEEADGDARRALTVLEAGADAVGDGGHVTVDVAREAMQLRFARYDKAGEEHYNLLSAYHKSLRGSDPQGALYWMARMLDGGEDPMTMFRRGIAMAAEDIGMADPQALILAVAARDAFHMLGEPEGYLPLAEMTVYLATAPKSNASARGLWSSMAAAKETPAAPVPLHIRNAPTKLHKELGYNAGYKYAHSYEHAYAPQDYLPDQLSDAVFYEPGDLGFEKKVRERLEWWKQLRAAAENGGGSGDDAVAADPATSSDEGPAGDASPDAPASPS